MQERLEQAARSEQSELGPREFAYASPCVATLASGLHNRKREFTKLCLIARAKARKAREDGTEWDAALAAGQYLVAELGELLRLQPHLIGQQGNPLHTRDGTGDSGRDGLTTVTRDRLLTPDGETDVALKVRQNTLFMIDKRSGSMMIRIAYS